MEAVGAGVVNGLPNMEPPVAVAEKRGAWEVDELAVETLLAVWPTAAEEPQCFQGRAVVEVSVTLPTAAEEESLVEEAPKVCVAAGALPLSASEGVVLPVTDEVAATEGLAPNIPKSVRSKAGFAMVGGAAMSDREKGLGKDPLGVKAFGGQGDT
jgi:hypothetical protein